VAATVLPAHIEVDGKVQTVTAERVISAVGITGNVENIGLEEVGVKFDRGHIITDGYSRTNVAGVYAIGDVAGAPWLAHKASHEGIICIEKIAGLNPHPLDPTKIPRLHLRPTRKWPVWG
jgi:dihydrolipoamide dehydrogenase